jgi:hypothetical protein
VWPHSSDDRWLNRQVRPASVSDIELTCQVIERIREDPGLADEFITVEVQNRVVNLIGTVSTLFARIAAADVARSTPGVLDISNRLALARVSVVTDWPDLQTDPFDDIVADWHTCRPEPQRTKSARSHHSGRMLGAAVGLVAMAAGIVLLSPVTLHPGAGVVVIACLTGAAMLAVRAGQTSL